MTDDNDERGALTRKADVLAVLSAGGHIYWHGQEGLYELTDKRGNRIDAKQSACRGALKEWHDKMMVRHG